ncbi:MAG: hypothetical protein HC821_01010 [Lewinella sp.]|nr:hypothetical protein [Lewinella sp.]
MLLRRSPPLAVRTINKKQADACLRITTLPMPSQQLIFILVWLFLVRGLGAQVAGPIVVNSNFTAQALVEDVFISGRCQTISNIQGIGPAAGRAFFSGGAGILGFDRGILLATGNPNAAVGPNRRNDTGSNLVGQTGDVDLSSIAANDIFDRVGLEFDFVPLDSNVTFRYIFASEEYCEFINTEYNDVFGFFVSGPGLNGPYTDGAINAALLPGSNQTVSINTVNHSTNSNFYRPNELAADQILCNLPQNPTPLREFFEYVWAHHSINR